MNIETKRKLNAMNMQDIAESIEAQEVNPAFYAQLSFEERLSSLINDIYQKRHNEKIQRRIKQAKLRYPSASLADVDYVSRKLDKGLLNELGTMNFYLLLQILSFKVLLEVVRHIFHVQLPKKLAKKTLKHSRLDYLKCYKKELKKKYYIEKINIFIN